MSRVLAVLLPLLLVAALAGCAVSGGAAPPSQAAADEPAVAAADPATEDEQGPGGTGSGAREPGAEARGASVPEGVVPAATDRVWLPAPTYGPPTAPPREAVAPSPDPTPEIEDGPFAMNLYRKGDFVAQYTFEWCVGASLQMMRNLTDAKVTRSRATQQDYWELARDLSNSPFGGANPRGWTAALNDLGYGPYTLVSIPRYEDALRVAASAIRDTDRPVGLVMWRGRHAWVMSGFTSDADPRAGDDFDVTGIRVLDPLYPHGSSVWGASPRPNSLLTPAKLARQFVFRDRRRVNLGVPPGYLLILPTDAA